MLSDNIGRTPEGVLTIAGQEVTRLAAEYGTPLYLMDEQRIRSNCRMYLKAFRENFPEDSLPLYASKAASFKQIYRIMAEEGMGVDVVSSGELYTALAAGFPAERIHFHGNCKTDADIAYGVASGIGCFIADNREELLALEKTAAGAGVTQAILLRVTPGRSSVLAVLRPATLLIKVDLPTLGMPRIITRTTRPACPFSA